MLTLEPIRGINLSDPASLDASGIDPASPRQVPRRA